mmetsp:Transcript_18388/g.58742  ORF Transcript_18388/g.58742 Transcript_18388/m.58742 type:complete len:396 (-) Transcript_18388:125-1312(-)
MLRAGRRLRVRSRLADAPCFAGGRNQCRQRRRLDVVKRSEEGAAARSEEMLIDGACTVRLEFGSKGGGAVTVGAGGSFSVSVATSGSLAATARVALRSPLARGIAPHRLDAPRLWCSRRRRRRRRSRRRRRRRRRRRDRRRRRRRLLHQSRGASRRCGAMPRASGERRATRAVAASDPLVATLTEKEPPAPTVTAPPPLLPNSSRTVQAPSMSISSLRAAAPSSLRLTTSSRRRWRHWLRPPAKQGASARRLRTRRRRPARSIGRVCWRSAARRSAIPSTTSAMQTPTQARRRGRASRRRAARVAGSAVRRAGPRVRAARRWWRRTATSTRAPCATAAGCLSAARRALRPTTRRASGRRRRPRRRKRARLGSARRARRSLEWPDALSKRPALSVR